MRTIASVVTLVLLASACGGGSEVAAPATTTTAAPAATVPRTTAPTTTVAPTTTATAAPTSTVASLSVDPQLDLAFAIAVEEFIATNWAGWSEGESLGRCLAANAADIDAPAKQGVIDYGLDEVYAHISQTDGYSLGSVWGYCEEQVPSGTSESGTADQSDESTAGTTAPVGLTVTCTLDVARAEISCQASGYQQGSQLTWTSTASWAASQGNQWDFTIGIELIAPTAEVFLEECQGSNCQIVETSIDTSILLGDDSMAEADLVESSAAQCDERVLFQYPPADLTAIELIIPMGNMNDSHVTPVDHAYFVNFLQPEREIDVFSPAEGIVTKIQRMTASIMEGVDEAIDDHRIVIDHPCSVSSYFIHVDNLAPRLQAEGPPPGGFVQVQIPVEAGELIGTYTQNLDYNIVDLNFTLDGFLVPSSYTMEAWKIHTPDYFDYYIPEVREQFIAKSPRTIEPIAGQIAYDIDGRLVGTWFQKDTNGYAGADRNRYWAGHLTFAYDKFDPRAIMVSVGTFDGRSTQGAVTGNSPDPADVTIESGLVLYELVLGDYYVDGTYWNGWNLVKGPTLVPRADSYGVIAVELVGDRELRVETFPGLKPADIEGFSGAALTYVR